MDQWLQTYAEAIFSRSADVNHDLKTPLNVSVLNLELLRMRLAKVAPEAGEDEKIREYAKTIETELRRMARIFDAVLHESVPPKERSAPEIVDLAPKFTRYYGEKPGFTCRVLMHEERAAKMVRMIAEGAAKIFQGAPAVTVDTSRKGWLAIRLTGEPSDGLVEFDKLFKFYYTDAAGNPEISLATARLIAESYGGTVTASRTEKEIILELALPSDGP